MKELIYKLALGISAICAIINAGASFWYYFNGDVLRGIFFIGGANLSIMMTLNFARLIGNIHGINFIIKDPT